MSNVAALPEDFLGVLFLQDGLIYLHVCIRHNFIEDLVRHEETPQLCSWIGRLCFVRDRFFNIQLVFRGALPFPDRDLLGPDDVPGWPVAFFVCSNFCNIPVNDKRPLLARMDNDFFLSNIKIEGKKTVLRIRDVYPGSDFFPSRFPDPNCLHPGSQIRTVSIPDPGSASKNFSILTQKNQCCWSGMFIPDPDFYPSRIPDPKTAMKDRGEKNLLS